MAFRVILDLNPPSLFILFNPTRRGLWNGHQEGGGAFNARSYKNPLQGPFGPIFLA